MGFLLGYLAEQEKQLRAETAVIAGIVGKARAENGLKAVLRVVFDDLLRIFGAHQALLAVQDMRSGRAFLWEAGREGEPEEIRLSSSELEFTRLGTYLFAARADVWYAARSDRARGAEGTDSLAVDHKGRRLRNESCPLPEDFLAVHAFRSLRAVSIRLGNEWSGRVFLLDPGPGARRKTEMRFLQTLVAQISPAIYSVYLLSRLRSHAEAMERPRVARELHDGIIQSLIAVEMQVQVLRRQAADGSTPIDDELARLQNILHEEILNLRELMEQMKPLEMNAAELPDFLGDSVNKFQRETGISARFVPEFEEVALAPRVCREVARIVQEALVNVRKHSGARNVLLRFTSENGNWNLVIDDDGCGFPFSGRLSQAELDSTRKGPMVIKERVRSIGGELTVEAIPGRGARLEITLVL
jgi:signal transduction histidine kinase